MNETTTKTQYAIWQPLAIGLIAGLLIFIDFQLPISRPFTNGLNYFFAITACIMVFSLKSSNLVGALIGAIVIAAIAALASAALSTAFLFRQDTTIAYLFLSAAVFMAFSFHQAFLDQSRKDDFYHALFDATWSGVIILLISFLFSAACWFILYICSNLLLSLGFSFFSTIITSQAFTTIVTMTLICASIALLKQKVKLVTAVRNILFVLCHFLLPLFSLLGLIMLFAIVMSKHEDSMLNHSFSYMSVSIVAIFLLNAVFQTGRSKAPYPKIIRYGLFNTFYCLFSVFPLLILVQAIDKNYHRGLDVGNFQLLILAIVLFGYTASYTASLVNNQKKWIGSIPTINIIMAVIVMLTTILMITSLYINFPLK